MFKAYEDEINIKSQALSKDSWLHGRGYFPYRASRL